MLQSSIVVCPVRLLEASAETEVGELDVTLAVQEKVVGLDVPVDEAHLVHAVHSADQLGDVEPGGRIFLIGYTPLTVKICLLLWKFFSKIFNFFPKFSIFFQNFQFFFQNFQKNSKFSEIFKIFKISKITIDFEYFPNIFRSIINNHTSWKFG